MKRILLLLTIISAVGLAVANTDTLGIKLGQNYPNPAKDKTYIDVSFTTEEATLKVYNILGTLVEVKHVTGNRIELDVSEYPDGVYLYTLEAGDERASRRMTVKKY